MNISLKCFAQLGKEGVCDYHDSTPHEITDGATVSDLIQTLGFRDEEIKVIYVNHHIVTPATVLQEGDRIAFAPPTGGM